MTWIMAVKDMAQKMKAEARVFIHTNVEMLAVETIHHLPVHPSTQRLAVPSVYPSTLHISTELRQGQMVDGDLEF